MGSLSSALKKKIASGLSLDLPTTLAVCLLPQDSGEEVGIARLPFKGILHRFLRKLFVEAERSYRSMRYESTLLVAVTEDECRFPFSVRTHSP